MLHKAIPNRHSNHRARRLSLPLTQSLTQKMKKKKTLRSGHPQPRAILPRTHSHSASQVNRRRPPVVIQQRISHPQVRIPAIANQRPSKTASHSDSQSCRLPSFAKRNACVPPPLLSKWCTILGWFPSQRTLDSPAALVFVLPVGRGRDVLGAVIARLYDDVLPVVAVTDGAQAVAPVLFEVVAVHVGRTSRCCSGCASRLGCCRDLRGRDIRPGGKSRQSSVEEAVGVDGGDVVAAVGVEVEDGLLPSFGLVARLS